MSPEQASADRELGPQADVYSVGCMLYEMLVGDPPHTGKTAQSVLAKILTERPRSVTEMRATVPVNVAAAVARSLERLPADRFETAEEFVRALGDASFTHELAAMPRPQAAMPEPIAAAPTPSPLRRWLPWGVATAALLVAAWSLRSTPPSAPAPTFRMALSDFVVENARGGGGWRIAISRDGATIVAGGEGDLLYVRRSDDTEFRPIPGTESGRHPAISPDGEWLAFTQSGALVKVQLAGGPVLPVVAEGRQPHWHVQEEIVFASPGGISRVSSAGGTPTLIAENTGGRPFMLPGSRALLADGPDGLYLHNLDTGERRLIGQGGSNGRHVPTGHVLYGDRTLQSVLAVPFDLDALEVTGSPVPVLPSVNIYSGGAVQLAVSDKGTLVDGLAIAGSRGGAERLTRIAMDGTRTDLPVDFAQGQVRAPRISPDGTLVAYEDQMAGEVFLYDFNTGERRQLTRELGASYPVWSPDGSSLYVTTAEHWYRAQLDAAQAPEQIAPNPGGPIIAVSGDERWLVIEEQSGEGSPNPALFYRGQSGMMRREVRLGSSVELGDEVTLFSRAAIRFDVTTRMYDLHPDGDQFVFVTGGTLEELPELEEFEGIGPVIVVLNWFEELRQRMGG